MGIGPCFIECQIGLWLGPMANPNAHAERSHCRTKVHGGVRHDVRTIHLVSRKGACEVVTRGSVRLPLGSNEWCRTSVQGFLPSLDLTRPCRTLPTWSPMVGPMAGPRL